MKFTGIIPSFIFLLLLVACGCMTQATAISYDADNPLIRFTNNGLMFRNAYVTPETAVKLMEKHRIPKDATIHLLVDRDYTNTRATWVFQRNFLARAGYTKSILVHERRAEAMLAKDLPKTKEINTKPNNNGRYHVREKIQIEDRSKGRHARHRHEGGAS